MNLRILLICIIAIPTLRISAQTTPIFNGQFSGTNNLFRNGSVLTSATGSQVDLRLGTVQISGTAVTTGTIPYARLGLPAIAGQSGKYLTNDGTNITWGTVSSGTGGGTILSVLGSGSTSGLYLTGTTVSGTSTIILNGTVSGGGGGGSAGVIGTAKFNPSSGTITDLSMTGAITGVVRASTGTYDITLTGQADNQYTTAINASDDNTHLTGFYLGGIASGYTSSGFRIMAVNVPASVTRDPQIVTITVFRYGGAGGGSSPVPYSATKTDTQTLSTTATWTDITGLSLTLTPKSTSSKLMVRANVNLGYNHTTNYTGMRLVRGSTAIGVGSDVGGTKTGVSGMSYNFDSNTTTVSSMEVMDEPATGSAVTYKVQFRTEGGTSYVNRSHNDYQYRSASTLTVIDY